MLRLCTIWMLLGFALALPLVGSAGAAPPSRAVPGTITEFPLPVQDSRPYTIVTGPDGALWFTESDRGVIGRITREGYLKEFRLPDPGSGPYGITVGADGNLWFTERFSDLIGKMTPYGKVTEYGGLTENAQPWDITAVRDGSLWFTEENVDQVGVIYPSGEVLEFPVGEGNLPTNITTGRSGKVWFTEELGNKIVRLTPGNPPKMVEYPLLTDGALPWDLNPGPDGNVWFTELAGRHIGKITPTGQVTEYPVSGEYGIDGIFADPRGDRMWFTENDSGDVGSIRLDGTVDAERLPTSPYPFGITAGPDGNMWFCVGYGNAIGRVNLSRAPLRSRGD